MAEASDPSRPARDWEALPNVVRARALLERGRSRSALSEAWKAATLAVNADDDRGLAVVRALAADVEGRSTGRTRRQAEVLGSYLEHCRDTSASGAKQGSLLARLFGGAKQARTKTCPQCAEQVKEKALVCRFCGHRFDATPH